MPKFTVQVKRVKAGKSYADPQVEYTFIQEGIIDLEIVNHFTNLSLDENNYIELEYKGK